MAQPREDESQGSRPRPHPLIRGAHASSNSILVNSCQRGNPILQHIKSVAWEFADIVPDYQVGLSSGVLFLSLRYFRLHPEYIHMRIQKLAHMYTLRILLVLCDVSAIKELTKIALLSRMVLLVAWTPEEAGRYLETYKAFEQRPPDTIRTRVGDTYQSQLTAALTSVRNINKTDVMTLSSHIGMAHAPPEKFMMLPGMGEAKVDNLVKAFRQPFRTDRVYRKPQQGTHSQEEPASTHDTNIPPESPAEDPAAPPDTALGEPLQDAEPLSMDALPENFDALPEEEQLRIAMQLSVNGLS